MAVAMLDGEVTPRSFSPSQLRRVDLKRSMRCVRVREEASLTAKFPARWSSVVAVDLRDGARHETRVEIPTGDPANLLPPDDLAAKFLKSAGWVLGPWAAQRLLDRSLEIQRLATLARLWAE